MTLKNANIFIKQMLEMTLILTVYSTSLPDTYKKRQVFFPVLCQQRLLPNSMQKTTLEVVTFGVRFRIAFEQFAFEQFAGETLSGRFLAVLGFGSTIG